MMDKPTAKAKPKAQKAAKVARSPGRPKARPKPEPVVEEPDDDDDDDGDDDDEDLDIEVDEECRVQNAAMQKIIGARKEGKKRQPWRGQDNMKYDSKSIECLNKYGGEAEIEVRRIKPALAHIGHMALSEFPRWSDLEKHLKVNEWDGTAQEYKITMYGRGRAYEAVCYMAFSDNPVRRGEWQIRLAELAQQVGMMQQQVPQQQVQQGYQQQAQGYPQTSPQAPQQGYPQGAPQAPHQGYPQPHQGPQPPHGQPPQSYPSQGYPQAPQQPQSPPQPPGFPQVPPQPQGYPQQQPGYQPPLPGYPMGYPSYPGFHPGFGYPQQPPQQVEPDEDEDDEDDDDDPVIGFQPPPPPPVEPDPRLFTMVSDLRSQIKMLKQQSRQMMKYPGGDQNQQQYMWAMIQMLQGQLSSMTQHLVEARQQAQAAVPPPPPPMQVPSLEQIVEAVRAQIQPPQQQQVWPQQQQAWAAMPPPPPWWPPNIPWPPPPPVETKPDKPQDPMANIQNAVKQLNEMKGLMVATGILPKEQPVAQPMPNPTSVAPSAPADNSPFIVHEMGPMRYVTDRKGRPTDLFTMAFMNLDNIKEIVGPALKTIRDLKDKLEDTSRYNEAIQMFESMQSQLARNQEIQAKQIADVQRLLQPKPEVAHAIENNQVEFAGVTSAPSPPPPPPQPRPSPTTGVTSESTGTGLLDGLANARRALEKSKR